jgi:hypothetical protein
MVGIRDPRSGIRKKTYSGSRIRVQGGKKAPDPESRIRIRNTVSNHSSSYHSPCDEQRDGMFLFSTNLAQYQNTFSCAKNLRQSFTTSKY